MLTLLAQLLAQAGQPFSLHEGFSTSNYHLWTIVGQDCSYCIFDRDIFKQRLEDSVMEEVNGKIMQQGFLESYFQMARKDLNQKAKDAQGEIRGLKSEIEQLEDRMKQMLRDMAL